MEALPRGVDSWAFSGMMRDVDSDVEWASFGDGCAIFTIYERLGDVVVLSTPTRIGLKAIQGGVELKMSEYWALRERAAEMPTERPTDAAPR